MAEINELVKTQLMTREDEVKSETSSLPSPSKARIAASRHDRSTSTEEVLTTSRRLSLTQPREKQPTIFYLAYGSNLAKETFEGKRKIRPISAVNVVVPSLRLAFNLPGIPYSEPCFANSATRPGYDPPGPPPLDEKAQLLAEVTSRPSYQKDRWQKGMVGVAYELTLPDFAQVIRTEGGGAAYQDVVVECNLLPKGTQNVPEEPTTECLKVHTLFAKPTSEPGDGLRLARPDPSYAQPSARYLKLLTDGAKEHDLPAEYQKYLQQIRPFRITTRRQMVGKAIFASTWVPIVMFIFTITRLFTHKDGTAPKWVVFLTSLVFRSAWTGYDGFFKPTFGEGERTEGEGPDSTAMDEKQLLQASMNPRPQKVKTYGDTI